MVQKFYLTFVNSQGLRILAHTNDGRLSFFSKKEGFDWLKLMYKNTSIDTIRSVFGDKPKFKVLPANFRSNGEACQTVFPLK
jgi:hypothetical protein